MKNDNDKLKTKPNYVVIEKAPFNEFGDKDSEKVVQYIVSKVISLAISNSFVSSLEPKLQKSCYDFITKVVNSYAFSQFIPHDSEDRALCNSRSMSVFNIDDSRNKSPIRKNESSQKSLNSIDYSYKQMFSNNYIRGENTDILPEEPKICECDRDAFTFIKTSYLSFVNNSKPPEPTKQSLNPVEEMKQHFKNRNNNPLETISPFTKKSKGNKQVNIDQFSCYEIADSRYHEEDNKDIDYSQLRREKEGEIKKSEEEKKIVKVQEKEDLKKKEENLKTIKSYKNKRLTTDVKGNIVFIKSIKPDNLCKEFVLTSTNLFNERKPDHKKTKKPKSPETESVEQTPKNEIIIRPQDAETLPLIDPLTGKYNSKGKVNIDTFINKTPYVPVGSCFDKINLEVGVTMKEDKKFKSGGKDFFKKFNKLSKENYNKQLKDTLSLNLSNTLSQFNMIKSQTAFAKTDVFSDTNTTNLFKGANTTSKTNIFSKNNLALSPLSTKRNTNREQTKNMLKVNPGMYSFKNIFDSDNREYTPKRLNNVNYFKNKSVNKNRDHTGINLEDVDNFTRTILNNEWITSKITKKNTERHIPLEPIGKYHKLKTEINTRVREFRNTTNNFSKNVFSPLKGKGLKKVKEQIKVE